MLVNTVKIEHYKSDEDRIKGNKQMKDRGWIIGSQRIVPGKRSILSWIFLGVFNFMRKKRPVWEVTYIKGGK